MKLRPHSIASVDLDAYPGLLPGLHALTNYRDPVNDKPVADAAKEYLLLREADHKQGHLSHRQFTSFRCELRALGVTISGASW